MIKFGVPKRQARLSEESFGTKSGQTSQFVRIWLDMTTSWQLQTAKAKFSKVVELCAEEGPQTITKHGRPVAHIISHDDYELWQRSGHKVDVAAKERRLKRIFRHRKLKGNSVLESRR